MVEVSRDDKVQFTGTDARQKRRHRATKMKMEPEPHADAYSVPRIFHDLSMIAAIACPQSRCGR